MTNDTLLLRQVNPSWVQQGRVTSQVFRPTPKDEKKLSAYWGDLISPEKAWEHYSITLRYASVGVMAVTVGECSKQGLPARLDPTLFAEHAIIDFTGFAENKIKKAAKLLLAAAKSRGWLYQAGNSAETIELH